MQQAQMPVLTFAQSRMVLMLGLSRGDVLPRDPQQHRRTGGIQRALGQEQLRGIRYRPKARSRHFKDTELADRTKAVFDRADDPV